MEKADRQVLKLSDSFDGESDIELKVTMININYGHNKELLDACKPLKEYSWFVAAVRENQKTMGDLEKAIDSAMNDLPEDSLIKPLFIVNKAEVKPELRLVSIVEIHCNKYTDERNLCGASCAAEARRLPPGRRRSRARLL